MPSNWRPLAAVCLGTFMLLVDVTIVNVALPSMATGLKTSFSSLQWVVDAYALALAALLMGMGSGGDVLGHRRTYISGLVLFALASLACGVAPNTATLVAARAVQGIGGAAMFATTFALLAASYRGKERGVAFGVWGAVNGAAAAIGPIAGGVLTQTLSWRWIFFVNLPISVVAVVLAVRSLPADRPDPTRRVDIPGTVVFSGAAAALVLAMVEAGSHGWSDQTVLALLAGAAVLLAAFVVVQLRVKHPLLDMHLLRNRTLSGVLVVALVVNVAGFAALAYTSLWMQTLLGLSPIEAGLVTLPLSIAAFVVAGAFGGRLDEANPSLVIGTGMTLIAAGALLEVVLIRSGSSWPSLLGGFAIAGVGVGLALPVLSAAAVAAVPPQRAGMAGGAVNSARQLGFAVGIAGLGSALTARATHVLDSHGVPSPRSAAAALAGGRAQALLPAGNGRGEISSALHAAFASGLDAAFLVAGIAGIVGAVAAFALIRVTPHAHGSTEATPPRLAEV